MSNKSNDRHIMFNKELNKWVNLREGNSRATSLHETQQEAYNAAKQNLINQGGGELSLHRKSDDAIRNKNTIEKKDPRKSNG